MEKTDEAQRAATEARTALVVLRGELHTPSVDTAKALRIVERLVDEADAGRDPLLLQDDWLDRVSWPAASLGLLGVGNQDACHSVRCTGTVLPEIPIYANRCWAGTK